MVNVFLCIQELEKDITKRMINLTTYKLKTLSHKNQT